MAVSLTYLFGCNQPWSAANWTSADDTVRGGSSHSYLTVLPQNTALFHGYLNTTALNGTGFASQETTDGYSWDLSKDDGLELTITGSNGKVYTLTVQDNPQPKQPNGSQQSSLVWAYDFKPADKGVKRVNWADLQATYRGEAVADPEPLNLKAIKRISIMIRSFFGKQGGDFSLGIASIAAFRNETSWTINPHDLQPMKGDPATEGIPTGPCKCDDYYKINPQDLQPMRGNPATEE